MQIKVEAIERACDDTGELPLQFCCNRCDVQRRHFRLHFHGLQRRLSRVHFCLAAAAILVVVFRFQRGLVDCTLLWQSVSKKKR